MATIEAIGLSKRYGARNALDGLTFAAEPGDVIGLLGPNGAGKTTTIRLLTTILEPTGGTFTVAGVPGDQPAPDQATHRRPAGERGLSRRGRPAREYLRYAARLFGQSRRDARAAADRLLAEVGLGDRAGARISTYSRGMKQRLGIARALINDPAVVFLDEPTLGLDPAGQREILGHHRARSPAERGATVVLSTHTLTEVEQVCGSVLILDHGRLRAAGPIAEVVAGGGQPERRVPQPHRGGRSMTSSRWTVVAEQESRDLWIGGRGPVLVFGFSVLLSAMTYLAATNRAMNFLEQREAVNLTVQVGLAVGVLLTIVVSADAISGERERGTFEALLLTPVSRRAIVVGKLAAATTMWLACLVVTLPYLWVLGRGVAGAGQAALLALVVGTLGRDRARPGSGCSSAR